MRKQNSENLDFYYGGMGSAKTAQLLMKYFNCKKDNGMEAVLLKPAIDDRYGDDYIQSRTGLKAEAIAIGKETNIKDLVLSMEHLPHILMLDEVQFFLPEQIEQLKELTDYHRVAVEVYGLKNNFKGTLFGEESGVIKRLLELATNIIEIKSYCACGNTVTNVARYNPENWKIEKDGPEIVIGGNNRYVSLCYKCWNKDAIPNTTRLRILESMLSEKTNVDKLIELKEQISAQKQTILQEELDDLTKERKKAKGRINKLEATLKGKE